MSNSVVVSVTRPVPLDQIGSPCPTSTPATFIPCLREAGIAEEIPTQITAANHRRWLAV